MAQKATVTQPLQLSCQMKNSEINKDELPSLVDFNDLVDEDQLPSTRTDCDIDENLFDDDNPLASIVPFQ